MTTVIAKRRFDFVMFKSHSMWFEKRENGRILSCSIPLSFQKRKEKWKIVDYKSCLDRLDTYEFDSTELMLAWLKEYCVKRGSYEEFLSDKPLSLKYEGKYT